MLKLNMHIYPVDLNTMRKMTDYNSSYNHLDSSVVVKIMHIASI